MANPEPVIYSPDARLVTPNRLRGDATCEGCRWPARCRQDAICWVREKADIAAERSA